jgi:hypothetical protein
MIQSRRHAVHKAKMRIVYEYSVRNSEAKRPLARPGRVWYKNIEMDEKEEWNLWT